ncbi:MAG TPA: DUF6062 family protein [Chloroflexota bacterium]|nr:DUF6062 family protein [Chloroflexota bacterium]
MWRRVAELVADCYAAGLARAHPAARLIAWASQQLLRLGRWLTGVLGLPFPWTAPVLWRTDRGEVRALLRKPGCPICRHVAEASARSYFWFLMEGYGEAAWIDQLTAAGGFCPPHMWQLAASGLAYRISYVVQYLSEDLVRRLRVVETSTGRRQRQARAALAALVRTAPCPLCAILERDARHAIDKLVGCLADTELAALYETADGLCWPHFQRAIARADGPVLRLLAEHQLQQLAATERALAAVATGGAAAAADRPSPVARATALLSGWRFHHRMERSHDGEWVELDTV